MAGEPAGHRLVVGHVELHQFDGDAGLGGHRLQLGRLADGADGAEHAQALRGQVEGGGPTDAAS